MNPPIKLWRVVWTDPSAEKTREGSEELVRRTAANNAEWHPIIETKVPGGDWEREGTSEAD